MYLKTMFELNQTKSELTEVWPLCCSSSLRSNVRHLFFVGAKFENWLLKKGAIITAWRDRALRTYL
jgi:hypothetical protein